MRAPFLFLLFFCFSVIKAQLPTVSYSKADSIYLQNFDGLPNSGAYALTGKGPHAISNSPINATGIVGWQLLMQSGSSTNAVFAPSTGSATGHGVYAVGTSGSTDRAFGSLASSAGIYAWGIILTNNTGLPLNNISIAFTAEQWRKGGSGNKNSWKVKFKTGSIASIDQNDCTEITALAFSSPINTTGAATLNGNLSENQQPLSLTAFQVNWQPGEQLLIRWEDADEAGSDDIMAIDNFSFSAKQAILNQPSVQSISPLLPVHPTNADTLQYHISLSGNITGLSTSNFNLLGSGMSNASITKIQGSGTEYVASIYTGTGAGYLQLGITNNNNLIPGLANIPFYGLDTQWIDKIKPIQSLFFGNTDTLLTANDTLTLFLQFNEPVFLDTTVGNNYIPVTIGSRVKNIPYARGNGTNTLQFNYIIANGESDKDGIRIASAFQNKSLAVVDMAGNAASLSINSTAIQKIKVDGIVSDFTQPKDTSITICNSSNYIALGNYLKVNNKEANERLYWKIEKAPSKYTIQQATFDTSANASTIQPSGFLLTNDKTINTLDSCEFSVSDGNNISYKKIRFRILSGYTWLGTTSTSWTEPNNWCNAMIPADSSQVQILANTIYSPTISSHILIKDLSIDSGAALLVTGSLAYEGYILAQKESIDLTAGTLQVKGTEPKSINPTIFKNNTVKKLLIDNLSTTSITNSLYITNALALYKGSLISNNFIYLTKSAVLLPSSIGTSIVGNIVVETGLLSRDFGDHLIGFPFSHPVEPAHVVNNFKLQLAEVGQYQVTKKPFANSTSSSMFLAVNTINRFTPDTISGNLFLGDKQIQVGSSDSAGFSLINNPYLHPIDMRALQMGTGVVKYYWIWNPALGTSGGFSCIRSDQPYTLQPYQSFAAYTYSLNNRNIDIKEEAKQLQLSTINELQFEDPTNYYMRLNLSASGVLQDQWVLSHRDAGKQQFDSLDAPKLLNPGINLFSKSTNDQSLAIDCRRIDNNISIPLCITQAPIGSYQFSVSHAFLPGNNQLVLHDRYLNKYMPLRTDSSYSFNVTSDSNSNKAGRFEISANLPVGSLDRLLHSLTIKTYPNPVKDELKVGISAASTATLSCSIYNPGGSLIKSIRPVETNKTLVTIPVAELSPGLYVLVVTHGSTTKSIQFIKQ